MEKVEIKTDKEKIELLGASVIAITDILKKALVSIADLNERLKKLEGKE